MFAAMTTFPRRLPGARLREELGDRPSDPILDPGPRNRARPCAGAGRARVLVHGRGGGGDHHLRRRPQPQARRLQRARVPAGPVGSGAARFGAEARRGAATRRAQRAVRGEPGEGIRSHRAGLRADRVRRRDDARFRRLGAEDHHRRPGPGAHADDRVPRAASARSPCNRSPPSGSPQSTPSPRRCPTERTALESDIERVGFQLVDHAIWRLAQLLAAVLVCLGIGTLGMLLLVRKLFFPPRA